MTINELQKELNAKNIPAKILYIEKTEYGLYEIIYTFDLDYIGRDYSNTNFLIEPELDELVDDIEEAVSFIAISYREALKRSENGK